MIFDLFIDHGSETAGYCGTSAEPKNKDLVSVLIYLAQIIYRFVN